MPTNPTVQLYNGLTQQLPGLIEKTYRDLPFDSGTIHPVQVDLQAGAEYVLQDVLTGESGKASLLAGDAMDIPLVSVGMQQDRKPIYMIASGYEISFKASRAAQFNARLNMAAKKQRLAARTISERINRFFAVGDASVNETGFLNNPNVGVRATTLDPSDPALTAIQLRDFFIDAIWNPYKNRVGATRFSSHMLISTGLYQKATTLLMPDTGLSVLQSVVASISNAGPDAAGVSAPAVNIWHTPEATASYLEQTGVKPDGTDEDRITVYCSDPDIVSAHTEALQQIPMEWMGMNAGLKVYGNFACVSGVMVEQPLHMEYYDIPAAAF